MDFALTEGCDILRRTPAILGALLRGLPEAWVRATEGSESWSAADVVGHLLHTEEVNWIPRARFILERGEGAAFEPLDRLAFIERWKGCRLEDLLDAFGRARGQSLHALEELGLTAEALGRRGRHPELGAVTLGQLLATWVVHDLNHVGQIVSTLARQYGGVVGPWKVYLGILDRSS